MKIQLLRRERLYVVLCILGSLNLIALTGSAALSTWKPDMLVVTLAALICLWINLGLLVAFNRKP